MGRRLFFVLGLVCATAGGAMFLHEGRINTMCNALIASPRQGVMMPAKCIDIVWPYSEGFLLLIAGAIFVFAALLLTRRVMSGERQYLKDVRAGKYDRENDHLNSYNFNLQRPLMQVGAGTRLSRRNFHAED